MSPGYCGSEYGRLARTRTLELTTGGQHPAPTSHPDTILVLYLGNPEAVAEKCERVGAAQVEPSNPYWGHTA